MQIIIIKEGQEITINSQSKLWLEQGRKILISKFYTFPDLLSVIASVDMFRDDLKKLNQDLYLLFRATENLRN